jgi:hypothetical protein
LDPLPAGSLLMVCGDYNILYSDEPAYQVLTTPGTDPDGQLFDPISTPGNWESNAAFAAVHTIGTDDMNARFDFILVSSALMDNVGSRVLPETYQAFGNDGLHFNRAINALPNEAVPDSVANALAAASDHLPVMTDFFLNSEGGGVADPGPLPNQFDLLTCYPNPFNPTLSVLISPLPTGTSLEVTDLLGRRVFNRAISAGTQTVSLNFGSYASGAYFVTLQTPTESVTRRVLLTR